MPDEEIDSGDIPELGDDFFRNAKLVMPAGKRQVTLRIDADVLDGSARRARAIRAG